MPPQMPAGDLGLLHSWQIIRPFRVSQRVSLSRAPDPGALSALSNDAADQGRLDVQRRLARQARRWVIGEVYMVLGAALRIGGGGLQRRLDPGADGFGPALLQDVVKVAAVVPTLRPGCGNPDVESRGPPAIDDA